MNELTIRDHFAISVMKGLLAIWDSMPPPGTHPSLASQAYQLADAMLSVRNGHDHYKDGAAVREAEIQRVTERVVKATEDSGSRSVPSG